MIQAQDLRLGNWVADNGIYTKVDVQMLRTLLAFKNNIKPIALDPEILLKAGFEFKGESDCYMIYVMPKNNLHISMAKSDIPFGFNDKKGCWYMGDNHTEIPNLHWLQNFVYYTYKIELTINLN